MACANRLSWRGTDAFPMMRALFLLALLTCACNLAGAQHRHTEQTRGGDGVTRVLIATPIGSDRMVTMTYTDSLYKTLNYYSVKRYAKDIEVRWLWASGSVLEHNRNMLAKYFLESEDLDYLLFVDSDVGWPPYMIERMVRFGEDIMAGVYPFKSFQWSRISRVARAGQITDDDDLQSAAAAFVFNHQSHFRKTPSGLRSDQGFVEAMQVGLGFTMIHRRVFEAIIEAYGPRLLAYYEAVDAQYYRFFQFTTMTDVTGRSRWTGEDLFFLELWASLGETAWADLHTGLRHQGTHVWDGRHFANSLQYSMGASASASTLQPLVDEVDAFAHAHPHATVSKGKVFPQMQPDSSHSADERPEL